MYTADAEAGARSEASVEKFKPGEIDGIVFAPLHRADFEPEVVIIYGNAAQVMRLVAAALFERGGRIASSFAARMDCSDHLVVPLRTGEPQVILPCNGDRIFAGWVDKYVEEWQITPAERPFDQIGWAKDIRDAIRLGQKHGRPVFLFTHDGRMATGRC